MNAPTGLIIPRQKRLDAPQQPLPGIAPPPSPSEGLLQDIDTPIPEGLPEPHLFRCLVMFVNQRSVSKGGIILTEETLTLQNWQHQLVKIAKVGAYVCKGAAYASYNVADEHIPKVGEIWLIDPKLPRRIVFDNTTFVWVNDDAFLGKVHSDTIQRFKFNGLDL